MRISCEVLRVRLGDQNRHPIGRGKTSAIRPIRPSELARLDDRDGPFPFMVRV